MTLTEVLSNHDAVTLAQRSGERLSQGDLISIDGKMILYRFPENPPVLGYQTKPGFVGAKGSEQVRHSGRLAKRHGDPCSKPRVNDHALDADKHRDLPGCFCPLGRRHCPSLEDLLDRQEHLAPRGEFDEDVLWRLTDHFDQPQLLEAPRTLRSAEVIAQKRLLDLGLLSQSPQ